MSGQDIVDWRPGSASAVTWNVVGVVVALLGLPLFALPALLRAGPGGGSFRVGIPQILFVAALAVVLMAVHEAIHGVVMRSFGARPRFGATLVARVAPALYTTSEGHRFTRGQYVTVALAPALLISLLGLAAASQPWGAYLVVPLAIHLGGCVGDGFATRRVLSEAPGTRCEDLPDGIRFHRPAM